VAENPTSLEKRLTIYNLEGIVERCLAEAEEAGYLKRIAFHRTTGEETSVVPGIVNRLELVKHISKTIIGELHEFEVIRRISPVFREFKRLAEDFAFFDEQQAEYQRLLATRVEPVQQRQQGEEGQEEGE